MYVHLSSVVRYLEVRQDEEAANVLGRAPGESLVYLEQLRLADGVPVILDRSWLPAVLAEPAQDQGASFEPLTAPASTPDAGCVTRPRSTTSSRVIRPWPSGRPSRAPGAGA